MRGTRCRVTNMRAVRCLDPDGISLWAIAWNASLLFVRIVDGLVRIAVKMHAPITFRILIVYPVTTGSGAPMLGTGPHAFCVLACQLPSSNK